MDCGKVWPLMVSVLSAMSDQSSSTAKTVEEAASDVLSHSGAVPMTPEETAFMMDCVVGASRFRPLCDGALQGYCDYLKRNKIDRHSMHLIAFVVVFKHRDLPPERMRQLLRKSTSTPRLVEYLTYLTDASALQAHSVPIWLHSYDKSFIMGTVLRELGQATPTVLKVVESLQAQSTAPAATHAAGGQAPPEEPSSASSPQRLAAKGPPQPQPLSNATPSASPPPPASAATAATSGTDPRVVRHPREARDRKRLPPAEVREMAHTLPEPRPPPVKLSKPKAANETASPAAMATGGGAAASSPRPQPRPTKPVGFTFHERESARAQASERRETDAAPQQRLLRFTAKDFSRVKQVLEKPIEVPTTNAALRREAHVHQQRREEEEKAFQELEINQHDATAFEEWRQAELAKDEQRRELQILERHLAALQSGENARAARAKEEQRRHRLFRAMKQDAVAGARQRRSEEERRSALQRRFVNDLREELARSRREAEQRALQEKWKSAEEMKQESEQARRAIHENEEQRKVEQAVVIQQIRLLRERVRQRQVEMIEQRRNGGSAVCGDGSRDSKPDDDALLHGMSMQQLRAELELVKARDSALEEERRQAILAAKAKEAAERAALEDVCRNERQRRRRDREIARQEEQSKTAAARAAQLESETERMIALQQRLQEKRQQRREEHQQMRGAERQRRNEANMRAVDDTAMERERWRQLEQGMVNRITAAQAAAADRV